MTSYVDCADDQQPLRVRADHDALRLRRHARCRCNARWRGSPSCPRDTERTRRALRRGVRDPAQRAGDAPACDRDQEGRARRVGRPRLDAGAPRRGAVHGRPRPPPHERARVHAAGIRDQHAHPPARAPTHGGARRARRAEIDIRPAATQMLRDLQHPAATGEQQSTTSPTRTSRPARARRCLFRLANLHDGTRRSAPATSPSSRSGWCTYGVGDQMSHYGDQRLGTEDPHPVPDPLGRRQRSRGRRRP